MGESKQVKVDNWGIFFLQRLQTFFNKTYFCDLTLQFEDNVQLKVHRLVLNACTEYFQLLENSSDMMDDCLIMPPDLQADVVVPIVNFMYTGILEFHTSIFDRLYSTARLMNMTVLTKLLDAQKVPISPIPKPLNKRGLVAPITWNLQGKKITPKTMDPDLPEQLPGRKLPIWKRKCIPTPSSPFATSILQTVPDPLTSKYFRSQDEPPKPTRFEWPEEEEGFDSNSFDEISYTSKPINLPVREKSPKPSTSNFDEIKRSSVKRAASPVYNDNKKVNIQDVKEYIKEQKIRSDYNDYDDSEAADNDLQSFDDNNDSEDDNITNVEETKSILKNDTTPSHNKRVRFSLEGKENNKSPGNETATAAKQNTTPDVSNHTKIITEVLKKFPQLVQKNKNIKLKILSKGQNNNSGSKPTGTPVKVVKSVSKVSYMVTKPNDANAKSPNSDKKEGEWTCTKCDPGPIIFKTYHAYRHHLTEVHNEKADSQMCNICGHISRKQNMLMYHKYVKHNIEPPPIFNFPKCKECSYIALSPSLLIKHQYNHTHQNLICAECSIAFPNKTDLIKHIQTTRHTGEASNTTTFNCNYCTKKFISADTLFQHVRNHHKDEAKSESERKENIITAEEIDALDERTTIVEEQIIQQEHVKEIPLSQENQQPEIVKPKEKKIKILSDIKVNNPIQTSRLLPMNKTITTIAENIEKVTAAQIDSQQLEPSSEAESLSNVASGIAASLGLVNTIVVLDENNHPFILQEGSQTIAGESNFILPEGTNIENIHVSQHQVITTDNNSIITQTELNKNNIGSTDELVMVLTDHDYSDATNNAVLTTDNSNIVVLYSHPVQGQDAQFISQQTNLMLNSNMSLVEVSSNYGVNNEVAVDDKSCEESIEMIQQEINNQLDAESKNAKENIEMIKEKDVVVVESQMPITSENIPLENPPESPEKMDIDTFETQVISEEQEKEPEILQSVIQENTAEIQETIEAKDTEILTTSPVEASQDNVQFEEPMEIEETLENIQQEIDNNLETNRNTEKLSNSQDINDTTENTNILESTKDKSLPILDDISSSNIISEHVKNTFENSENINESIVELNETENKGTTKGETENDIVVLKEKEDNVIKQEYIEHMEVDSAKISVDIKDNLAEDTNAESSEINENSESIINDISTEILKDNIEICNEQENNTLESKNISQNIVVQVNIENDAEDIPEDENLQNTESTDIVDSGINVNTNLISSPPEELSETCADISHISDSESIAQTLDEVSDIPVDSSSEMSIIQYSEPDNENKNNDEQKNSPKEISEESTQNITEMELNDNNAELENIENKILEEETNTSDKETDIPIKNEIDETININDENLTNETKKLNCTIVSNKSDEQSSITNSKISNLLDDWDDGDTDSQQSDTPRQSNPSKKDMIDNRSSINTLINDWEDEED